MRAKEVAIRTESIGLDQFLKWAGAVLSGGEAKSLVQSGAVAVNGETETRRGRQLRPGDTVTLTDSTEFLVVSGGS